MPEPFTVLAGKAAPLAADDVDTDQIIPAQFLKVTEKSGLGRYLFYRWRYAEDGKLTGSFVLDQPQYGGSKIIVAGRNFGIGSSRENAVWALLDAGVRCVIASSFGDIFYNNSSRNGLLCLRLPESTVSSLREKAVGGGLALTIDLESQTLSVGGEGIGFEIERHVKERLLAGADDVALTLGFYQDRIEEYEAASPGYFLPRKMA